MRPRTDSAAQWTSDLYSYVDQPNSNLLCCICQYPFVEPTTTRTCAHTFCRNCILHALNTSPHCPIDRSSLSPEDLVPATPIIRDMVDELVVRCSNEADGCSARVQRQLLKAHIREDCQYTRVSCPDPQCGLPVLRRHARDGLCVHTRSLAEDDMPVASSSTTCAVCSKHLPNAEALAAHTSECASCPQSTHGCLWRGRADDLNDSHLKTCPYRSLNGFFAIHDSRAARLEEENRVLKVRLEATEGLVRTLLGDMVALKSVLGPFIPDAQVQTGLQAEPSPSSSLGSSPARHDPPSPHARSPSDFASYFPPALPSSPARVDPSATGATSPGTLAFHDHATMSNLGSVPTQSGTLHAHISSLTGSLETMAGEQEAYRRDADAAHAQLGSEVGALRATVGGLRMYVSELSSTVGALVADRGGLPVDGVGLGGSAGMPLPWLGRVYGSPSYGPGFSHQGPLAPPFALSSPPSVPVKL
ncbi:hypothetical protein PENSPDRAFT_759354 [Peniophora sp. CONT]|nr:hypothetical protein PENSPDRAFT_759354 [Peniophora sp. CONT]